MKKFILLTISIAIVISILTGCSTETVYRLIKVNSSQGTVTIHREETLDVFEGLQLVSEDLVKVGNASFLELLADSDKHIIAESDTAFILHSTGTETSGNITIDLLYGSSLITIDNKLPDSSFFEVNTPNALLSVRGTSFFVAYDSEAEITSVEVMDGIVDVITDEGSEELTAGEAVIVTNEGIEAGRIDYIDYPVNTIPPPSFPEETTLDQNESDINIEPETLNEIEIGEDIEELPDNGVEFAVTLSQTEFESEYMLEKIELTPENSREYFEIIEKNGEYWFVLKPGYGFYSENHDVETNYGDYYYKKNYSRYICCMDEGLDVREWISEWTARGTIVKHTIPDDMWCKIGDSCIVNVEKDDGSIIQIER